MTGAKSHQLTKSRTLFRSVVWLALVLTVGSVSIPGRAFGLEEEETKIGGAFFRRFGQDLRDVVASPAHWRGKDFARLAIVGAAGLGLFAFDQQIQDAVQEKRTETTDDIASVGNFFGNGGVLLGMSAALYGAGEITGSESLRRSALLSAESLAAATVFVWAAKVVVGRARPYTGESSRDFHPFSFSSRFWSMPSGHAASAFAVATAIAGRSESPVVDSIAYGMAALATLSRVNDNKHWVSDVFIGASIGYAVARKVLDLDKKRNDRRIAWTLGFQGSGTRRAVVLGISF